MKKKFIKFLKEHKVYGEFRKFTWINGRFILPDFDESVKSYVRCGDVLNMVNLRDSFGNYLWQLWELEYNKNNKPSNNTFYDYLSHNVSYASLGHYFKCNDGYYDDLLTNGTYLRKPHGQLFYNTFDFETS